MIKECEIDFLLLKDSSEYPYELLLLADETKSAIDKYLYDSIVYVVKKNNENIAVFCLYEIDAKTIELKNIAVSESFQNLGIGSKIINFIKEIVGKQYSNIIVGTADCGLNQIRFYERNGFNKFAIRENFFIDNYEFPIIENGIRLKDMILLKCEL